MTVVVDLFKVLRDSELLTAAFIIGAIAVFIAIVGNIKALIELSFTRAFVLALLGLGLMSISVVGYFISLQVTSTDATTKGATPVAVAVATNTPFPNPTAVLPVATRLLPTSIPLPPTTAPSQPVLPKSREELLCIAQPHTSLAQGNYTFAGTVHIVELWRADRQSPWGDKSVTAVVYGNLNIVNAGGSVWTYPAGCEDAAKRDASDSVKRTGAQLVTESELRAAGMIK